MTNHPTDVQHTARHWYDQAQISPIGYAVQCSEKAHCLEPDNLRYLQDHAERLMEVGRVEEGVVLFQKVIEHAPEAVDLRIGLLWNLLYLPGYSRQFFAREYTHWAQASPVDPITHFANQPHPDKRLRVGVLSGNFRDNSVMSPFESLWSLLDPSLVQIIPYSNVRAPDAGTHRWQTNWPEFKDISPLSDEQAAQTIHDDGIDILLEVGGHCRDSRIGVFAYQPAPVQVDYGGLSTLGLPQVQHRFSSTLLDPADALSSYPETTHFLSPFLPFIPPTPCPDVTESPVLKQGHLTFGVVSNNRKINNKMVTLWCQILKEVPSAKLLFKTPIGSDPDIQQFYLSQFIQQGIAAERVTIKGQTSYTEHLHSISQCDVLLDTYPFNGARGTMEALWMGVPTVSLVGDLWISRWGLALHSECGLEVFAAHSDEEFIGKAVHFAQQPQELAAIRHALRPLMQNSPIGDGHGWVKQFQTALRVMWREWCGEKLEHRNNRTTDHQIQ